MDLSLIFNVPGKPGLYKLISQGKNSAIMESLVDKKRAPFFGLDKMSSLAEIAIYTEADEIPLADVFRAIHKKENGGACLGHKEDAKKVRDYFAVVLPTYDRERVYESNIRKVLQWYNLLQKEGLVDQELSEREKAREEAIKEHEEAEAKAAAKTEPKAEKAPAKAKAEPKAAKAPAKAKAEPKAEKAAKAPAKAKAEPKAAAKTEKAAKPAAKAKKSAE
ncbi:MAG: DUF5606 domain-containing protein [Bacteroidales bacterium]|nr:DUF5606 domain-containing protein [Bacteroidales bacterium]